MPKPSIPAVPKTATDHGRHLFDSSLKESVERITGQRGGKLTKLEGTAGLADVIAKINELIDRLQ